MNTASDLTEQVSELRWLIYELGNELNTLATTPYPQVHRLLMQCLAKKVAQVAQRTCESLSQSVPTPVARPEEVQPIEQSA